MAPAGHPRRAGGKQTLAAGRFGGRIAGRNRADARQLRELGFEVLEIDGQDHIGGLAETDLIAPRILAALGEDGW